MDFSLSPPLLALRDKTRQFIAEQVIPLENDERQSSHGPSEALRRELVGRARVERRERTDDARLALRDHQVRVGNDEQGRGDHRDS